MHHHQQQRWLAIHTTAARAAQTFHQQVEKLESQAKVATKHKQTQLYCDSHTGQNAINSTIQNNYTPHLQVLQRPTHQGVFEKNTYTTDPAEIDQIMQSAWARVYDGNTEDQHTLVNKFCQKYKDYIYTAKPMTIHPIQWHGIKWACTHNSQTAGWPDGWTKNDLYWASDRAFR